MDDNKDKQKHRYYNLSQELSNSSLAEKLNITSLLQLLIKADLLEDNIKSRSIFFDYQNQLNQQFIQQLQKWIETHFVRQSCSEAYEELADLLVNIGIYYLESPYRIRPCDIDAIIAVHRIALRIYTTHKDYVKSPLLKKKAAKALNLLGNVHIKCAELGVEPVKNIEDAIEHYKLSALLRQQLNLEDDLSSTFNNLGRAYQLQVEQLGIEPTQNIEKSIKYYEKSIEIQRRLNLNNKLSSTLSNLGNLYQIRAKMLNLIRFNRSDIELAIKLYTESAEIRRLLKLDRELSFTLRNLGGAYQALAQVESDAVVKLKLAINCYKEAIAIQRYSKLEGDLASTLNNLGTVYQILANLSIEASLNLNRAIDFYLEAKTIREQFGLDRALAYTLSNLGAAYLRQSQLEIEPASNREQAIVCYCKALTIIKPTLFPIDCFKIAQALGNLGFYQSDWNLAIDGYTTAIQAIEQIRIWAGSDQRRQEVLENAIGIYDKALQCYINLGQEVESQGQHEEALKQYQKAILLTERARSRHLVDLIHSNDLYQGGEIRAEIQQYLEEYENLQQQINQLRQQQCPDDSALSGTRLRFILQTQKIVKDAVKELLQRKEEVWRMLRAKDPVLAGQLEVPPLDFDQLAKLIADRSKTAILSFYSTNDHTYIFVVRHSETGITCDVQTCEKQSKQEFQLWIAQNWLVPYQANFGTWRKQMPQQLQKLSQKLQLNQLIAQHLQGIEELILIPHIFLHLIPFAALPLAPSSNNQKEQYLGDHFRLRVVPSAQILKYCHDRENNGFAPMVPGAGFGTVEDATGDRPIVTSGFEQVAKLLNIPDHQRLRGPQQATLTNYRQLTCNPDIRALHSIHHAGSDLENPLESALVLANHERLTLGQLMSPGWRMPHLVEVFLSCCETNLGLPNVTDDIVTLSAGFLCAGARAVISTLWSVDALATALFCDFYYQFREKGSDRPTALQQAQQELRLLSGEQLANLPLNQQLEQQLAEAYYRRRTSKAQLESLPEDHRDRAIWKQEQEYWERLERELAKALDQLESYQKVAYPFQSPYYWAGFVCQGLR